MQEGRCRSKATLRYRMSSKPAFGYYNKKENIKKLKILGAKEMTNIKRLSIPAGYLSWVPSTHQNLLNPVVNSSGVRKPLPSASRASNTSSNSSRLRGNSWCSLWKQSRQHLSTCWWSWGPRAWSDLFLTLLVQKSFVGCQLMHPTIFYVICKEPYVCIY